MFKLFWLVSFHVGLLAYTDYTTENSLNSWHVNLKNESFTYDVNYEQLCVTDNFKQIHPFIEEQWFEARKDLNLPRNLSFYANKTKVELDHNFHIHSIYRFFTNVKIYQINGNRIGYLKLLKCANEAIMKNLKEYLTKQDVAKAKSPMTTLKDRNALISHISKLKEQGFIMPLSGSKLKVFTYIRDPISKLESGWAQVIEMNGNLNKISITMLRQWYIDILNYKLIQQNGNWRTDSKYSNVGIRHIFPISSSFFEFNVDILLALENFTYNWENIVVPTYGLKPYSFNNELGLHASSIHHSPDLLKSLQKANNTEINSNKTKSNKHKIINFRHVLFPNIKKEDPKLWQAMCRLILIDYVCFPQYKLPKSCQHLQKDVERGRVMLLKKKIINSVDDLS